MVSFGTPQSLRSVVMPALLLRLLEATKTREVRRFVLAIVVPWEEDLETKGEELGQYSDDPETQNADDECDSGRDDTSERSNHSEDVYGTMLVAKPYKTRKLTSPEHAFVKRVIVRFRTIDPQGDEGDNE